MALLLSSRAVGTRPLFNRIRITDTSGVITRFNSSQVNVSKYIINESPFKNEGSWFRRLQYRVGVGDTNIVALRRASVFHYQACTDQLEPGLFFEHLKLPDTLFAFFLVIQLHVWMCQTRSMMDGPEGRKLRNEIIERMWQDIDTRLQKAAIFSYDEGLLTDDKTLAGALWRTLYSKAEDVDPCALELSVKYVRTQMNHLRSIGSRDWCLDGKFSWAPFPPINYAVIPRSL